MSASTFTQRLGSLPAERFARVRHTVLPQVAARWQVRQRALPPEIAWVQARYTQLLVCDGSTLDGLLRKVGLLYEAT